MEKIIKDLQMELHSLDKKISIENLRRRIKFVDDLKYITLSGFSLDEIPSSIYGFDCIDFSYNNLTKIDISPLYLNISFNKLSKLPSVDGIQKLILSNNNLSGKLDIDFSSLLFIDLSNNHLSHVNIIEGSNLLRLDIQNNGLQEINGLGKCKYLLYLNLSINEIEDLAGVQNLKKLKFIDLSFNKFVKAPYGVTTLPNLTFMDPLFDDSSPVKPTSNLFPSDFNVNKLFFVHKSESNEEDKSETLIKNLRRIMF